MRRAPRRAARPFAAQQQLEASLPAQARHRSADAAGVNAAGVNAGGTSHTARHRLWRRRRRRGNALPVGQTDEGQHSGAGATRAATAAAAGGERSGTRSRTGAKRLRQKSRAHAARTTQWRRQLMGLSHARRRESATLCRMLTGNDVRRRGRQRRRACRTCRASTKDAQRAGANFNKVVGRRWRASAVSRCASAPSFRCAKAALTRRARMNASEVAGTYKRAYKAATTSPIRPCSSVRPPATQHRGAAAGQTSSGSTQHP